MWSLLCEDGSVFRGGFQNQWDAVRTAKKENGTHYKKAEAMSLKTGTEVFRDSCETVVVEIPTVKRDGTPGGITKQKMQKVSRLKLILTEEGV